MADFPAFCGRCNDITPHDYPYPAPHPPLCMRCAHGPSFRATYGPLTPAARKRLMSVPPEQARGVRLAKEQQDGPGGVVAMLLMLVGAIIIVVLFAAR